MYVVFLCRSRLRLARTQHEARSATLCGSYVHLHFRMASQIWAVGRPSTPKLINFDRPGNHFWHFGIALDEHTTISRTSGLSTAARTINRDESANVQSSPIFADASRLCASPYEPLCAGARWRRSAACLSVQGAAPPAASESCCNTTNQHNQP